MRSASVDQVANVHGLLGSFHESRNINSNRNETGITEIG